MTMLFEIVGLGIWFFRKHMSLIRKGIVAFLILMALVMKAPIWYLFARLSDVTGGTGWHRSYLLDQAFRHFNEWWLFGTQVTGHWMPYALAINPLKADITNAYLAEGVNGGILTMVLFITIIVFLFKGIGKALDIFKSYSITHEKVVWCIGASLLGHVVALFSVTYFDQTIIYWYFLCSSIAMLSVYKGPEGADGGAFETPQAVPAGN
jgi:hypothetical protein